MTNGPNQFHHHHHQNIHSDNNNNNVLCEFLFWKKISFYKCLMVISICICDCLVGLLVYQLFWMFFFQIKINRASNNFLSKYFLLSRKKNEWWNIIDINVWLSNLLYDFLIFSFIHPDDNQIDNHHYQSWWWPDDDLCRHSSVQLGWMIMVISPIFSLFLSEIFYKRFLLVSSNLFVCLWCSFPMFHHFVSLFFFLVNCCLETNRNTHSMRCFVVIHISKTFSSFDDIQQKKQKKNEI